MKPQQLKDNALFLSCWYERSRPVQIVCFGVLLFSIMAIACLNVTIQGKTATDKLHGYFLVLAAMQAVVLLLQGTLFAWHMGGRERTSETLDFHRNTPQAVRDKMLGLVFGSTLFEWAFFALAFAAELPFALLPKVSLSSILLYNTSLIMSGIFFHTSAVAVSLITTTKKSRFSLLGLLLILWFTGPLIAFMLSNASSSLFGHLFGATALTYLFPKEAFLSWHGWFFTMDLPLIVLQAIVQVPLLLLMINGIRRVFVMPNSPAWSKADVIRFCGYVLFLLAGFYLAGVTHAGELFSKDACKHHYIQYCWHGDSLKSFIQEQTGTFVALYVIMGVAFSLFLAPTYFKCSKYYVLRHKGLSPRGDLLDDGASGLASLVIYMALGAAFFGFYVLPGKFLSGTAILCFVMASSYVMWFAGFLEYYRLSRFRHNKLFFLTVLLVWWAFVPWLIFVLMRFNWDTANSMTTMTPFVGIFTGVSALFDHKTMRASCYVIPLAAAVLAWLLVLRERTALENSSKYRDT